MFDKEYLVKEIAKREEFTEEFLLTKEYEELNNYYDTILTKEQLSKANTEKKELESRITDINITINSLNKRLEKLILESK